ncbi:MAG: TonB family protein [Sandaracinaceae bacterium]
MSPETVEPHPSERTGRSGPILLGLGCFLVLLFAAAAVGAAWFLWSSVAAMVEPSPVEAGAAAPIAPTTEGGKPGTEPAVEPPSPGSGATAAEGGDETEAVVAADTPPAGGEAHSGRLDSSVIRRVVGRRAREVQRCYDAGVRFNPRLEGRVEVAFVIDGSGRVQDVDLPTSTLGAPAVEACIRRAVERWRFPAPEGGSVEVRYPFMFRSDR